MANRFIPYVPKPTNEKQSNKPLCKNLPKQPSTIDSSQHIKWNSTPIRASAMDSDLLMQKVNGDDGIMVEGTLIQHNLWCLILIQVERLVEVFNNSDNGNETIDDTYFPTVPELISTMWEGKSTLGLNLGDSQGECTNSSSL